MLNLSIPGRGKLQLHHLVLDMNGTITTDGLLPEGVMERVEALKSSLKIYLLTADTFGTGARVAHELGIEMVTVSRDNGTLDKANFTHSLEPQGVVAIGNGNNDLEMVKQAQLSIVIIGQEGCSVQTLVNADIAVNHINDALDLLLHPLRLIATLRN